MVITNSCFVLRMALFFVAALGGVRALSANAADTVSVKAFNELELSRYSELLGKYVTADKKVKYASWLSSANDLAQLQDFIEAIGNLDLRNKSQDYKMAFYINAYNAMTIDLILTQFPKTLGGKNSPYPNARSIRNIDNLDSKVWDKYKWKVAGKNLSLNDVEHKILRPMGDARIHFAIVCASKGCPPILNQAFSSENLDEILERLTDEFVNGGQSTVFNLEKKQIDTSKIVSWFSQDFVKSFGSVKNFFAKYVTVIPSKDVAKMKVKYVNYDWLLNIADEDLRLLQENDFRGGEINGNSGQSSKERR